MPFLYCDHIVPIGLGNPFEKFRSDNVYMIPVIYTVYSIQCACTHFCTQANMLVRKNIVSLKQDGL